MQIAYAVHNFSIMIDRRVLCQENTCQEIEKCFHSLGTRFSYAEFLSIVSFFLPFESGVTFFAHTSYVPLFHVLAFGDREREGEMKRRSVNSFVTWS